MVKKDSDSPASEFATIDGAATESSHVVGTPGRVPEVLGNYQIVGTLGSGGMGIVLKAYDPALNRYAALKIIRTEHPDLAVRFVQEARAQARVQHEHVCQVYEVGEMDGKQYIAMQLIEGDTLSVASREMTLEAKVHVIQQIAGALHVAHKQGLIHRDIKPSNIMLERNEEGEWKPYIMDFGLAREQDAPGLTRTGVTMGTPHYMAPEQVQQELLDRRTDVYGLGATLYELLSGQPPYSGNSGPEIMLQILKDDPVPVGKLAPKIPPDLQTIVMKCLERDPSRRYNSAKALSEDLQRYLEGDPIGAKPTSWSYRVIKRAKKNRLATGIALSGAAITILLVGAFLWIQWQNRLQASYAREFGDEIKNIQSVLPGIYTAPIHDVRPELTQLRNRLITMERRVNQGGRAAGGPGNNALGHGYLALGEIEKAKEYLEKAWESGYQLPSTAYALGQTMGLLFQKKLAEAERNPGEAVREKMKKQYEKEFRDPAIHYLKLAEGSVESPAYVEGLIALYEKKYDQALQKAKQAYAKSRWSYDAKVLEGKALSGMAQNQSEAADYKGAIKNYELAGEAYAQASELGRSRADIYLSDCDRWGQTMKIQIYTDVNLVSALQNAEEACNKAILINPDDAVHHLRKAYVYYALARYYLYNSSEDPRILLKKSIDSLNQAQRKDPNNWEPSHLLLTVNALASEYELRHGIDPYKTLQTAIAHANRSLKIRPNNPAVFLNLGMAYVTLAEYHDQTGKNPIETYEKAIQQYKRVEQIDPTIHTGNEQGIAYWFIASSQKKRGEDPSNSYRRSIEQYQSFLKGAPDDPYVVYNLGILYGDQGKYDAGLGKDPTDSFRKALKTQHHAAKFIPNNSYISNSIGYMHISMADYLVSKDKDPGADLKEGRKFLLQASQIDEKYYMPYSNMGYAESVNARWAVKEGISPLPHYDAARKAYLKSIECNKGEPATYGGMAEMYQSEAKWLIEQRRPAKASIEKGLKWIEKSLKMNADDPGTIAIQGELFLLQARIETDPAARKRSAVSAVTALEKAIKLNSQLKKEYDPRIKEARALLM